MITTLPTQVVSSHKSSHVSVKSSQVVWFWLSWLWVILVSTGLESHFSTKVRAVTHWVMLTAPRVPKKLLVLTCLLAPRFTIATIMFSVAMNGSSWLMRLSITYTTQRSSVSLITCSRKSCQNVKHRTSCLGLSKCQCISIVIQWSIFQRQLIMCCFLSVSFSPSNFTPHTHNMHVCSQ